MERFFLEHSVLRDRDADELSGRRIGSDSEASDPEEEATDRVRSVADPTGPWRQTPVARDAGWGQPEAPRAAAPRAYRSAHTGPKGVIRDFKAHKRHERQERVRKEAERQRTLLRIANGATASEQQQLQQGGGDDSDEDEDEDEALADPAAVDAYRQQRLAQLRAAALAPPAGLVFGELEFLSPERFVELVDLARPGGRMLVHLFAPESYACELLNRELERLAGELVHVKFAAMEAKQADASIAAADLPIVLLYRGAELAETVVHVSAELGGAFTPESVDRFVRGRLGL